MTTIKATHRHVKSGKLVTVIGRGLDEATLEPTVGYVDLDNGSVWFRKATVFDDGRFETVDMTDFAWLIEAASSKISDPLYFSGMDTLGRFKWTRDHSLAVRFTREQDAQKVAGGDTFGTNHRVCEHGWEAERSAAPCAVTESIADGSGDPTNAPAG